MTFSAENAKCWINEIREKKFFDFTKRDAVDGVFVNGLAVLEDGWLDIELNISSESIPEGYENKLVPSYFCCAKGLENGEETWAEYGYLDDIGYDVEVDWSADDWEDQLKADMERKLKQVAKDYGLHFDKPNWEGSVYDYIYYLNNL